MKSWQYSELKNKVEMDLATQEELFVQPAEMLGYFNEALDQAEQEILGLYEDYYLSKQTLSLVSGQEEYSLPADIYAEKIRRVIFNNGSTFYTLDRIRDWKKFEIYTLKKILQTSDLYEYFLYNPSPVQSKMILVPPSRETGPYLTVWYIRAATHFTGLDTDVLDMPEAANFMMKYVKVQILEKDMNPNLGKEMEDLERERDLLKTALSTMVPDTNNYIEADFSFYEEMN